MSLELIIDGLLVRVEQDGPHGYLEAAALKLDLPPGGIRIVKMLSKALITGDSRQFYYKVSLVADVPDGYDNPYGFASYAAKPAARPDTAPAGQRAVIIGFGPAGMFAALELLERGICPLIFERGKRLEERHLDVDRFMTERILDPESNIQFGEGGAGSYSDGKLFSRVNNSEYADKVLDTFIKFGAPPEIGYVAKPHLGTDVLRKIVGNIRDHILERGGEIRYGSRMTDIITDGGKALGVVINGSERHLCASVYLAIGNSARDTFAMLHEKKVRLEPKPISVGVRIEHPASAVNYIRYGGKYRDFPGLGAATYSFNHTDRITGRGAYTFCMCPGGEVINASSQAGLLALNGMSYAARDSAFSNSAIAVTCVPADYGSDHPLAGIEFQMGIERNAFKAGGSDWHIPAQNLRDFLNGTLSGAVNGNSCRMGTRSADMARIFPDFVNGTLRAAFAHWRTECPLFVSDEAVLMGAETRTSSPVRILRGDDFQSVNLSNLYPIGEGSGYSGGITSSAVDAIKAVETSLKIPAS